MSGPDPTEVRVAPQPLNPTDAALWDVERDPRLRSAIVAVLRLDRPIAHDVLTDTMEAATRSVVRLRQRVVTGTAGIGRPHWEVDPAFDLAEHLDIVTTPAAASPARVDELVDELASTPFDRDRPLWHCTYLCDPAGPGAMVLKVHHSLTDGVGGVQLLDTLLDTTPAAAPHDPSALPVPRPSPAEPHPGRSLADLLHASTWAPRQLTSIARATLQHPIEAIGDAGRVTGSAIRLLSPASAPCSPLMTGRGETRRSATATVEMGRLADAAHRLGCTINHLLVAGVIGGIARYHADHDAQLDALRVAMPVSTRDAGDAAGGNQWAPVRFVAPASGHDPLEQVVRIGALVRGARDEPALPVSQHLAGVVQALPSVLSSTVVASMMGGVDVVVTDVPGLTEARYLAGARVVSLHALAPTGGAALNVSLVSHAHTGCVGILMDPAAIADTATMATRVIEGIEEVLDAAGASSRPLPPAPRDPVPPERLSSLDASFLELESSSTPMHLGAAMLIDGVGLRDEQGAIRLDDARRHIEARLSTVPRFVRRLRSLPGGVGRPLWVDHPDFDIAEHVEVVAVASPGGLKELLDLSAMLLEAPLPRDRPLWKIWIVDGMADGSVGMIDKVHHALIDGVGGVELMATIFDTAPHPEPDRANRPTPSSAPGTLRAVTGAIVDQVSDPLRAARASFSSARALPARIGAAVGKAATVFDIAGPRSMTRPAPFNRPVGPRRELRAVVVERGRIDAFDRQHATTLNDVVLASVAGALRTWLLAMRASVFDIHALVPVSVREDGTVGAQGNVVGAVLVELPVAEPDAHRRLRVVHERMRRLKDRHEGADIAELYRALDHLPPIGYRALTRLASVQPYANLVITNIPGPDLPLYFLGGRVTEMVPVVPLGPRMGLGVAVLSYTDRVTISLFADPAACPDIDELAAGVLDELDALL